MNNPDTSHVPAQEWEALLTPESIGWSGTWLHQVQDYAQETGSFAGLLVSHGRVLASWGQITLPSPAVRSAKPSSTACMATIADLLTSRSGVYHPSNYQTARDRARLPQRGSHAPGTFWYYNNWDFNALGTIYEQCTQTRIFEEFERCIARPLHMQDYRVDGMRYLFQDYSLHPSYSFRISARDLARFGLLYLRQGRWRGQSIVPQPWVHVSTTTHAQTPAGPGFGYLWWVCSSGHLFYDMPLPDGSYASYGFGGQYLLVIPSLDAVGVHLGDPGDPDYRPPTVEQACHLLQLILNASPVGKKQLI